MLSDFLRVGVLTSRRAPGLETLLHHPFRGTLYEIDCVITSDPAFPDCGVPVITHPIRTFYDERNAELCDRDIRAEYDAATAAMLHHLGVDTLLLIGYLYLVTDPLLNDFGDHILNVHDGVSRYPGLHATRDAIVAGEEATRSIVHVVTRDGDAGPVVVQSDPFPVAPFVREALAAGHDDIVRAYAYAHREWTMRGCWGDLLVRALEQVAAGSEALV